MGARFSSNNDYNRILATQAPTSISIPRFEPPNHSYQTHDETLLIPDPLRFLRKGRNDPLVVSDQISRTQSLIETNPLPTAGKIDTSPMINNQPQSQFVVQNTDRSIQSNIPTHDQKMMNNAFVLARSIINRNDHRYANHFSSAIRPYHSIVERNGKQFLVEFEERIERRYVQCMDETTHRMRFFEVIDRIPCRTVRRHYQNSHSPFYNKKLGNTFQSDQHSALSSTHCDRLLQPSLFSRKSINRSNQSFNVSQPFNNQSNQNFISSLMYNSQDNHDYYISHSTFPNNRLIQPSSSQSSPPKPLSNQFKQQTNPPSTLSDQSIRSDTSSSVSRSETSQTSSGSHTPVNRQMSNNQRQQVSSTIPPAPPPPPDVNLKASQKSVIPPAPPLHPDLNLKASQKPVIPLPPPPPPSAPNTPFNSKDTRTNSYQDSKSNIPDEYTSSDKQESAFSDRKNSRQFRSTASTTKPSYRPHSPTISKGRSSSSNISHDIEEEDEVKENAIVNRMSRSKKPLNGDYEQKTSRNNTIDSDGRVNGSDSLTTVDPFARPKNPGDKHLYRRQPLARAYDEPIANHRALRLRNYPDYAPIPASIERPSNHEYSRRSNVQKQNEYNYS